MAKRFGVMLDCSRNAVMKPEKLAEFASIIKKMGYDTLMIYTEDTYEIPGEPYFGYLRGRYTREELRYVSERCREIGVEVIPAIQTLAHLPAMFRWGAYASVRDNASILLADEEKTYELIRKMFSACREAYPYSKTVNIGMDEAHTLGLGAYLSKHGYTDPAKILLKHLERVIGIAAEFGFEPIMWSDMFFRLEHGGEYESLFTPEEVRLSDETVALAPEGVSQVFWRYHDTKKEGYALMMREHKRFPGESWFAGGAWTWAGFAANNRGTLKAMIPAVEACREEGVENVVLTLWGDDGKECSFYALLPSLFAVRRAYDGITDEETLKREFFAITGEDFFDMMALDIPGDYGNAKIYNATHHKYSLYNDPFSGFLDPALTDKAPSSYRTAASLLERIAAKGTPFSYLYDSAAKLCRTLEVKYDLGPRTRAAYKAGDRGALKAICGDYGKAAARTLEFAAALKTLWFKENKPQGFEVQEHRLGGLAYRLGSMKARLEEYSLGSEKLIPELEEEILPFWGTEKKKAYFEGDTLPFVNSWSSIITVNRI
ncbi:MAG: beta-N-acetylhexosaminidase [Clostridia bacterium]|nr:beta-N-acetylhexosaminidase [Clostridia bacterium]